MTQETVLYLDVDGVINALGAPVVRARAGWRNEWVTQMVRGGGSSWQITHSVELIERINALVESGSVEPRWLTTWTMDAALNLGPAVGLNGSRAWRVVGRDHYEQDRPLRATWWKFDALLDDHQDERIIWVDDDLVSSHHAQEWAKAHEDTVLAISPNFRCGVTRAQMEAIEEFASR